MLLDRWFLEILAERLDIGGDVERLDIGDLADLVPVAPGEEPGRLAQGPLIRTRIYFALCKTAAKVFFARAKMRCFPIVANCTNSMVGWCCGLATIKKFCPSAVH